MLALVAALALSCSVREDDMPVMGGTVSFKATLADAPFTKTVLQSDGSVYWSPGDAVNLFYGATGSTRLEADNKEAAAQVNFTGTLEGFVPDGSSYFWAVYPYDEANSFDGSAVTLTLPAVQTAVAGTFADDLFVTMAHSKDYKLQFYNVCGGVKFSVAGEGIKYVTFKGNSDEVLAGKVKVGLDEEGKPQVKEVVDGKKEIRVDAPGGGTFETGKWYYVVAFPDTLASGYTMSFYDDKLLAERVENSSVILKRSVWGKLTEADDVNITATKWLTFASEGTTTISLSNTDDNAPVLYYSYDKTNWTQWDYSALTFTSTDTLYLCGDNPGGFSSSDLKYSCFDDDLDNYSISGDIMSLLAYDKDLLVIPNSNCFYQLFYGCEHLIHAPALPATTLKKLCYYKMFSDCKHLTTAPEELPATTLVEGCYAGMFYACEELKTAPVLPADILTDHCYDIMFSGCSKLEYVKCLATNISATDCTASWLKDVSQSGSFVKASGMNDWPEGINGIPAGWTVENVVTASKYLTFTSEGTTTISLSSFSSNTPKLYYSYDKTNWTEWDYSALEFTSSSPLYLCGDNPGGFSSGLGINQFVDDGSNYGVSGDIMSLLDYDNDIKEIPSIKCFSSLFYGCKLTEAPSLPATTLTESCYSYMFRNCANLKVAPDLPATKLPGLCYASMFTGCSGLQTAPEVIPASTLEKSCCEFMFQNCTSLKVAPNLPATTLAIMCYRNMFDGCTSLTTAPEELPATTLAASCYLSMFNRCNSLTTVPEELPATTLATSCYRNMFYDCRQLQTAPVLPAEILVESCYQSMFGSCTILNYVKCLAKNIDAELCTTNWLKGVNSSGTFVKASGMTGWSSGESGIPAGWTVENAE